MQNSDKIWLIKGGQVIIGNNLVKKDICIKGEQIACIGNYIGCNADEVIDASGLLVFPGAVDTHVHFNDEFMGTVSVHDYYTGTLAAAYGGVTSIIDFSNQVKGQSLVDTIKVKQEEAKDRAIVDWGVHPVITQPTLDTLKEIPKVVEQGAPTIKCYMTYRDEGLLIEKDDLKKIASRLKDAGGMLMLHAEDDRILEQEKSGILEAKLFTPDFHAESRPIVAEIKAIKTAIDIAQETATRLFIVHMSISEGAEMIEKAQQSGIDIIAETCTHYLVFTKNILERKDGIKWICSPPLRMAGNQELLWKYLKEGKIVMVTSDDAAYSWKAKLLGKDRFDKCPNGIPGIEPRFSILYSEGVAKGRISLQKFVELVAENPAKIFGLSPQKGFLVPDSDADIVLFDPNEKWIMGKDTLHMNADWSAYENIEITGKIKKVFSRGELIIDGEKCLAKKGRGRYIHRKLS